MLEQVEQTALLANMVLPVGWLPLGTMAAAEGNMLTPLLGFLGMADHRCGQSVPGVPHNHAQCLRAQPRPQSPG